MSGSRFSRLLATVMLRHGFGMIRFKGHLCAEKDGIRMAFKALDLSGRTAVVIGGTSGIGHALALGLAEAGADVVPTSRRGDLVAQTASEIEALGRRSLRCTSDVQDRNSLEQVLAGAIDAFGKVDILINCAGRTK